MVNDWFKKFKNFILNLDFVSQKITKINKCFGFDLRTGGFIIGWLGLLEALLLLGSTLTYTQFYYKKSSVNGSFDMIA